ncbi:LysR family transcriptional regulator [Pseudonocardia phyllosphaerae]|uniref:LysR family transcriptional regulator n=1 Tax=Pseudonocardia phyllosphaerae TaxID=3390502 RepID=UPI003977FC32
MGPDVSLRRWYYFTVLADELNFTRAAVRLHVSQPSLSQQIRILERELGVALLDRDGPRFRLTEAGYVAATEAKALLDQVELASHRVRAAGRGESGCLRIAYTRSAPGPQAGALVSAYRQRHPQVRIETETGWTSRNIERLEEDAIDIAFVRPPVVAAALTVQIIGTEEILIALPDFHPLAARERIDRCEIAREPVVFWSRDNGAGWYDEIRAQVWPQDGPIVVREEPDDEQLMRAVADGAGLATVPEHRAEGLRVAGVTLRRLTDPVPRVGLALAYRAGTVNQLVLNFATLAGQPPA